MQYNLEYHKELNRIHILPNILKGAKTGIISQFLSDLFLSIFLYNEKIILKDIQVSSLPAYYASVATGMLTGLLIIYLDPIAIIAFTTICYNFVFALTDYYLYGNVIKFSAIETTFDIGTLSLLVTLFDPTARHQYLRYQQKRNFIEPTIKRKDKNTTIIIFLTILTSTYGYLKLQNKAQKN